MLIKEFCAENFTDIPAAITAGAKRIELCDNLTVGGTTVSQGVMEKTISYCHERDVAVMTIIRPRGGNFVYNDTELKIMHTDLIEAKKLETDGVVIGCLTTDNQLDEEAMALLLEAADGLQVTFHMAFDQLSPDAQLEAIDWLAERGVTRILTHGGPAGTLIENNLSALKTLIDYSQNKLTILPGGGLHYDNLQVIVDSLEVNEVHGTKIVKL